MSGQLSLAAAGWWPEAETGSRSSSLDFVLSQIPMIGHRKGTWREASKRPIAALYYRSSERAALGFEPTEHRVWELAEARKYRWRDAFRRVARTHGDSPYALDMLNGMDRQVADFEDLLAPGLSCCGINGRRGFILLPALDPLVIALCWDASVRAGCLLASFAAPGSVRWVCNLDIALSAGMPWAERLAVLAAKHEPLVRAWHWLHERDQPHPLRPRPS